MDHEILSIIKWAVIIVLGAISYYLKSKNTISNHICNLIAEAENKYSIMSKYGKKKMSYCIDRLYAEYIPPFLKKIFTRKMLEEMIQNTFDTLEDYVNQKINIASPKTNKMHRQAGTLVMKERSDNSVDALKTKKEE